MLSAGRRRTRVARHLLLPSCHIPVHSPRQYLADGERQPVPHAHLRLGRVRLPPLSLPLFSFMWRQGIRRQMSVNRLFLVVVGTHSIIDLSQPQARVNFPLTPPCGVTFAGAYCDDPNRDTGPGNDRFAAAYAPAFDDI